MSTKIRFLLLQVRNPDDPIKRQEVRCFAQHLGCPESGIQTRDLISDPPSDTALAAADIVLLGGSGDYSVAQGGDWLAAALDAMRHLVEIHKPTFASCWGFQAMAKALGGGVITNLDQAELGTIDIQLTDSALTDPVFEILPPVFKGQSGHQDIVVQLPADAVCLASTARVENQAFTLPGEPIYCTQFHPELDRKALLERLANYPQYVERIAGMTYDEFIEHCGEATDSNALLRRFVALVTQ